MGMQAALLTSAALTAEVNALKESHNFLARALALRQPMSQCCSRGRGCIVLLSCLLITHKYRGSQQFSRVEYSTQIY